MAHPFAFLLFSAGAALMITAVTLPNRQAPAVLNAAGNATSKIELSSLGIK